MEDRRVRLQSSDGEFFRVTVPVARISRTIATLLDELGCEEGDVIPLPNVNSRILKKVLAWANHQMETTWCTVEPGTDTTATPSPPSSSSSTATPPNPDPSGPVSPAGSVAPPFQPRPLPIVHQRSLYRSIRMPPGYVLSPWDSEFLYRNRHDLYDLLLAANYLDMKGLMDMLCKTVADTIKGKDPEAIRRTFNAPEPEPDQPPPPPPPGGDVGSSGTASPSTSRDVS